MSLVSLINPGHVYWFKTQDLFHLQIQYTFIGLTTVLTINLSSTCILDVTPDLSHQLNQYIFPVCKLEMMLRLINVIGLINLPRACILALNSRPVSFTYPVHVNWFDSGPSH